MHRDILLQCLPCLGALLVAFAVLVALVKLSGARLHWRRLVQLHRCQDGGVQSLAFVLTLPLAIMVMQFVVQVSQLMIGVMVVNYAAYAAARSACVWVPAELEGVPQNWIDASITIEPDLPDDVTIALSRRNSLANSPRPARDKLREIGLAAALACAPVAPSRDLRGSDRSLLMSRDVQSLQRMYRALVPSSEANSRTNPRLANKLAYSIENTVVRMGYEFKNEVDGPTHNPFPYAFGFNSQGEMVIYRRFNPHEIDWEDPMTLSVVHNFALLPGPGRLLARRLVRGPDNVSGRIGTDASRLYDEQIHTVAIEASVTFTNEGLKSILPYVHEEL